MTYYITEALRKSVEGRQKTVAILGDRLVRTGASVIFLKSMAGVT